jgi:hypothetical protein
MQACLPVARRLVAALASLLVAVAAGAASMPPDWNAASGVDTIQIVTRDEQGTRRERTIWLVVIDGRGYIRAGGTSRWDAGIDLHPEVEVEIEGIRYPLRATRIPEDSELYDAVNRAMREKYGFSDALIGVFRGIGGRPRILRLDGPAGLR